MELILLQKVTNLGNLGDKVSVKPGYGRNFLVPQGKAVPATAANTAEFEARRAEYEAKAQAQLGDAESRKVYQEVISKYADQKAAVEQARERLGSSSTERLRFHARRMKPFSCRLVRCLCTVASEERPKRRPISSRLGA